MDNMADEHWPYFKAWYLTEGWKSSCCRTDNINRKPAGNMENKINKASNGGQNKFASYKFYMQNAKYIINV